MHIYAIQLILNTLLKFLNLLDSTNKFKENFIKNNFNCKL